MELSNTNCPRCQSKETKVSRKYQTKENGFRNEWACQDCHCHFSETKNTPLAGIRKPISLICQAINNRNGGMGLNETCQVCHISTNTLLSWERKFESIKNTLMIYVLLHSFLEQIIEGDELYTKVNKNNPASKSEGWTIVLMERGSRFVYEMICGRKNKGLFLNALDVLRAIILETDDLTLVTDGERRYGKILFEICHEIVNHGKKGKAVKTLLKGLKVRLKNKGSKAKRKAQKRKKYESPQVEHPETKQNIKNKDIHANHVEGLNASIRRRNSAYRRKTNTYAKSTKGLQRTLDIFWVMHNFVRVHFTTKEVPAVQLGIIEKGLTLEDILKIRIAA